MGCPGSNVTEEEVRIAEDKFEESKSSAETAMHNLLEAEVGGTRQEILSQDMYPVAKCASCCRTCILSQDTHPVAKRVSCRRTMCPVEKCASCRRTHILLQNLHPVAGHHPVAKQASCCRTCILLQNVHPVAGHAPCCKTCILSKAVHPVDGYASCCKTHILSKDKHPLAKQASSCKTGILSKDVKGHASCQSVENKEVCFFVCVCVCMCMEYFIVPHGKRRLPYPCKAQQLQEQRYPLLSVRAVFSYAQTVIYGCQCWDF